jgi:hypothetical protein
MALAFSVLFGFAGIAASLPAFGFLWSAPNREKATVCDGDLLTLAAAATASGAERDR